MRDEVTKHIEDSLANIRTMFERAAARIEALPEDGKTKIPATKLAEEIGQEFGLSGPTLYPTMLFLFKGYPGTELHRGARGGIVKVTAKDKPVTDKASDATEVPEKDTNE